MIGICPDIATRQIGATSGLVACRPERTMPKPQAHKERGGGAFQSTGGNTVDSTPQQVHRSRKPGDNGGCDPRWSR
jgi:hypothetical protein